MKRMHVSLTFSILLLTLVGCQSAPKPPKDVERALDQAIAETEAFHGPKALSHIPADVQQELIQQGLQQAQAGLLAEKRLDIAANNVQAKHFFAALVEDSPYSIAIHPEVDGEITLQLTEVTIVEALDIIQQLYGYKINRHNDIIQVYPAGMRTETIALNYLFIQRYGQSSSNINTGGVSGNASNGNGSGSGNSSGNGSNNSNSNNSNNNQGNNSNQGGNSQSMGNGSSGVNISTSNKSDFWLELQDSLISLLGEEDGRRIIVSPQAGLVTVRALPQEINDIKTLLKNMETHLGRQVIIEAKIMEVTLNDDYQQGVRWEQILGHIGSTNVVASTSLGASAASSISNLLGGVTSVAFSNQDFSGVIDLLSTQGNVQVLSSPRITATNNQKAVIKVGEDEYFVTGVSSTTTTGTSTTTTPEIELTPFFSGIALDVTPQIDVDGTVILHVHPSVTITEEIEKVIDLGGSPIRLPLAQSNVRESDTVIRAKSGEIVVIGGLIETRSNDVNSQTPLLGNIPFIGELFKHKKQTTRKTELVIMLKPVVVGQDTWKHQLQDARALLKEWFPQDETFPEETAQDDSQLND